MLAIREDMTRQEMEQCKSLRQEIKSIEEAMKSPKSTLVNVFYKDYRTGVGIPKSKMEWDSGEDNIRILEGNLKGCKRKLLRQLNKAEKFIETVENSETRTILRKYYITGMSQEEIADDMHYTQGRISQILNAFWMSQIEAAKTNKK